MNCDCRALIYGIMTAVCFADVRVGSPSSGADALPNGLDVTFEVTEIKRLTGSYNTMVGNNEGSMVRETPSVTFPLCITPALS